MTEKEKKEIEKQRMKQEEQERQMKRQGVSITSGLIGDALNLQSPPIKGSSGYSGNAGYIGNKDFILIIESPIEVVPAYYNKYFGRPLNGYCPLSSLNGFAIVSEYRYSGNSITEDEILRIKNILSEGVIFN